MAIGYIKRIAGPFTGAGTTELPFGFMVYAATDIYVALAASESATAETLEYGTDYTVTLNEDQETTPGGTVTLVTALTEGQVAAVGSDLDYTQPTQLTNFSRFPPEIINDALDRIVILIQQLVEKLDRAVMVPTTSSMTPEELVAKLEAAADSAEKVASAYAAQAGTSASEAAASAKKAADAVAGLEDTEAELEAKLQAEAVVQKATVTAEGTKQTGLVTAEGTKQTGLVTDEGTKQLAYIQTKIDYIETVAPSKEKVETVADNIASVNAVAPHADDLGEIAEHLDEVHTVGQDLQGVNADSLDLGNVADTPDKVTTITDGYIKKVAEHIDDCIHPVALHIDAVQFVADNLGVIVVDDALSTTSIRAVQNKVVTAALATKVDSSSLATVATSGSYNDLTDKPNIPEGATVDSALSESSTNPVQNKIINSALGLKANTADLATVAISGSYNDLSDKPTIPAAVTKTSQLTNDSGYLTSIADASITAAKLADIIDLGSM